MGPKDGIWQREVFVSSKRDCWGLHGERRSRGSRNLGRGLRRFLARVARRLPAWIRARGVLGAAPASRARRVSPGRLRGDQRPRLRGSLSQPAAMEPSGVHLQGGVRRGRLHPCRASFLLTHFFLPRVHWRQCRVLCVELACRRNIPMMIFASVRVRPWSFSGPCTRSRMIRSASVSSTVTRSRFCFGSVLTAGTYGTIGTNGASTKGKGSESVDAEPCERGGDYGIATVSRKASALTRPSSPR